MTDDNLEICPCDLCGSDNAEEIDVARFYTEGAPVHVCRDCGFVYVRRRRSAQAIADSWSHDIYGTGYTARIPAVKARQTYVADTLDVTLGLRGKSLCDIGGGEGEFLRIARGEEYGAQVFAIEPSTANCTRLKEMGIDHFNGTIEQFVEGGSGGKSGFDLVTIMWTLENCRSPRLMLDAAYAVLKEGGHLAIATGSRLMVPFRKPLWSYFHVGHQDTHGTRYSANSLQGMLATAGFEPEFVNRYLDTDYLIAIGRKTDRSKEINWTRDDPREVLAFFRRWHAETTYYPEPKV